MNEFLIELRFKLKNDINNTPKLLSSIRKSYIEARDLITDLDRSLSWVHFMDNTLTMYRNEENLIYNF